jgi:hypothetical protein
MNCDLVDGDWMYCALAIKFGTILVFVNFHGVDFLSFSCGI